ncbi:hypothetical protein GC173_07110 [bacterium]|nr:hypothetical protein [bacterium]
MLRRLTLALLLTPALALAQAPSLVNYQGLLVDADGKPLVTGSYRLEFNVYTAESAGTRTWGPKTYATAAVQDGYFNVILDVDSDGDPFSVALDGPDRWLGIKVDNGTELRQQLLSAPYALRAETATVATRLQASAWTEYFTSSNPATAKSKDADKLDGIDSAAIFVDPANTSAPKAKLAAQSDLATTLPSDSVTHSLLAPFTGNEAHFATSEPVTWGQDVVSGPNWIPVTGLECSITTKGRPVFVTLGSRAGGEVRVTLDPGVTANIFCRARMRIVRETGSDSPVEVSGQRIGIQAGASNVYKRIYLPPSAIQAIDVPPEGTHRYRVEFLAEDVTNLLVSEVYIQAIEL